VLAGSAIDGGRSTPLGNDAQPATMATSQARASRRHRLGQRHGGCADGVMACSSVMGLKEHKETTGQTGSRLASAAGSTRYRHEDPGRCEQTRFKTGWAD